MSRATNKNQLEEKMVEIPERERRLGILESQKLDKRIGWPEFTVLAIFGAVIPAVLIAVGWAAGA